MYVPLGRNALVAHLFKCNVNKEALIRLYDAAEASSFFSYPFAAIK